MARYEEAAMHNTHDTQATLVLGGTSKTGRRVAAWLMKRCFPVRIGLRPGRQPCDWQGRDIGATATTSVRGVQR